MDSNLLKVFIEVADNLSFSKAAISLNCAQSNVTARIKQLEKNLDEKLFHRIPKGVILTNFANELYPHAKEIILKLNVLEKKLKNLKKQDSIKIASTESAAVTKVVDLLSALHTSYPNMDIELHTGPTQEVVDMINSYKVDIGFISGKPNDSDIKILKEYKEKLFIVSSKNTKDNQNILTFKKGCSYRRILNEYLNTQQKEYKTIEFGSLETIIGCVKIGMGITLLPESVIKKFDSEKDLVLKPLPKNIKNISTYMVCRRDNEPFISSTLKKY